MRSPERAQQPPNISGSSRAGTEQQRTVLPQDKWQLLKSEPAARLLSDAKQLISEPVMEQDLAELCPGLLLLLEELLSVARRCDTHALNQKLAACIRRLWQHFSVLAVGSPFAESACSTGMGSLFVNTDLPFLCFAYGTRHSSAQCRKIKTRLEACIAQRW